MLQDNYLIPIDNQLDFDSFKTGRVFECIHKKRFMAQIIVENGTLPKKEFELKVEFITVREGAYTFYAGTAFCPVELDVCPWKSLSEYSFSFRRNYNWTDIKSVEIHAPEDEVGGIDTGKLIDQVITLIEEYEVRNN